MAAIDAQSVAAVLVAAGSGERLGASVPKAFCDINGRTLLEHATARFAEHPAVGSIVVVAPVSQLVAAAELVGRPAVAGGTTRQESVAAGLAVLGPSVEYVLVHDVARPFVPASVITAVVDALASGAEAVVPVLPVADTLRHVDGLGVLDRSGVVAVQTPQGFRRSLLDRAHAAGRGQSATDDAALVDALGVGVAFVPGADEAFKITRPWDLALAEAVAARG